MIKELIAITRLIDDATSERDAARSQLREARIIIKKLERTERARDECIASLEAKVAGLETQLRNKP